MNKILILSAFDNYSYAVRIKYVEKYFENIGYDVSILSADFDHRNKRKYQVERKNLNYVHVRPYKKICQLHGYYHIESSHKKLSNMQKK